jgi:hypothetical protein
MAPASVAGSWGAAVARSDELESLWLGCAHSASDYAERMGAVLNVDYGSNQIALFTPKLQKAAAMGLRDRVLRKAHVEQHPTLLKKSSGWMRREEIFEDF